MKQLYKKFKESKLKKVLLMILSLIAGADLIFNPASIPVIIVRLIGVWWVLEGLAIALDFVSKWLERIQDQEGLVSCTVCEGIGATVEDLNNDQVCEWCEGTGVVKENG